jgi:tight adherence protein C
MSPQLIITVSVTISVACALLGLYYLWRDNKSPTFVERLSVISERETRCLRPESPTKTENPTGLLDTKAPGLLNAIVPRLSGGLKPRTGIEQEKLKLKMARAGFNGNHAAELFLGLKMICLIGGGFLGSAIGLIVVGIHRPVLFWAGTGACVLFYLPDMVLRWLTVKRQEEIQLSLPKAIDLMIITLEVGQGLDAAINRVTKEMWRTSRALSQEFALYNLQLQMGKSRCDALHDLGMRCGVPDMNSFAGVLIQADRFGASITKTMRQLSESARRKRRQRAEERAQKTAVKMIFPLVLFIFPGLFIVLVGPAMLLLYRDLASTH